MGTNCEEKQSFLQLPETLAELRTRLVDMGLSFINQLLLKGELEPACLGRLETLLPSGDGLPRGQQLGFWALVREHGLCEPSPGDSTSWEPMPLSGRTLGCGSVLSRAPPSSPGIKMNSYEVLPPDVDRKTLLKCESSVLGSSPRGRKERNRALGCPDRPSPTSIQARAPERCQVSPALTLYSGLETSEGL